MRLQKISTNCLAANRDHDLQCALAACVLVISTNEDEMSWHQQNDIVCWHMLFEDGAFHSEVSQQSTK